MTEFPVIRPQIRKVLAGVASRQQMYALFNRHSQAPFDDARISGRLYAGEWFEVTERDHDRMFEILPPLFYRGDMFAMREFLAASVTSVFFSLMIGRRSRFFHGYCDLARNRAANNASPQATSPELMREAILERETRPDHAMSAQEKRDHIWSTTAAEFRAYADGRFPPDFRGRQIVVVFNASQGKVWKLLDDLNDAEITAKLPVQFRHQLEIVAA
ncbi:DUF1419 domain-containing protein [Rhizobium ruizarguesonis]